MHYTEECDLPARVRKAEGLIKVNTERKETLRRENEQIWTRCIAEHAKAVNEVGVEYKQSVELI